MFQKSGGRMDVTRTVSLVTLVVTLLVSAVSIARAAGGAQAFGYTWPTNLKGHRVYIWTGTPPDGEVWTATPVAMCERCDCVNRKIETGWIKGTAYGLGDGLKQYIGYTDLDGTWQQRFNLGNLNDNKWYQVKVMYSRSADRWEAWRFNDVVWYAPHSLAWTRGCIVVAGSENNDAQGWMGVWGWHPEYRKWDGRWTLYNYTASHTTGRGHIQHAYDFGYGAWGP